MQDDAGQTTEFISEFGLTMNCIGTPVGGQIGLTRCPGISGHLDEDLQWMTAAPTCMLISLLSTSELRAIGVPELGRQVRRTGIDWRQLPISDMQVPTPAFMAGWPVIRQQVKTHLTAGKRVVVHCRAGLGRAGMISAAMLTHCGVAPVDAIRQIRLARPGAIETLSQERWIFAQMSRPGADQP